MADLYSNDSGSKKKFLAPVLVMLLCMVSLSGAAFAYSATVDNTGDDVVIDGVNITLSTNDPIFTVPNSMHIATHNTNGKAIWYSTHKAFNSAGEYVTDFDPANPSLASYKDGYYVEVLNGTSSGYHSATERSNANFTGEESALNALGIYKVSEAAATLSVENGTAAAVSVTAAVSAVGAVSAGIADVYIVVKSTGNEPAIVCTEKLSEDGSTTFSATAAAGVTTTFTVEAYIAISDYWSQGLPTFGTNSFVVSFATA